MDMAVSLGLFTAAMLGCVFFDLSTIYGLSAGYVIFALAALRRKCTLKRLISVSASGIKDVLVVIKILLIIGALTATWRMSGTIVYFVYYGVRLITPRLFVISAFLLTCVISYALGTSFGVSATVGVILMAIAVSGGVNPALAAGAIFSGVYFGDRGSPVASSANVVAAMTGTDIYGNVKLMHKTAAAPFIMTCIIYAALSISNPIGIMSTDMLSAIEKDFNLSHLLICPVIIMLVLPLFKVSISSTCTLSIAAAGAVSIFIQNDSLPAFIKTCLFGYTPGSSALGSMLQGGGIFSMAEVIVILIISCTYSKIFEDTGMMSGISAGIGRFISRFGRFPACFLFGTAAVCVFCNQTIASIVAATMLKEAYTKSGGTMRELAIDLENSVILTAGIVPWSIASSAPLNFMGADSSAIPYAFLLFLIPLWYAATKKKISF